MAYERGRVAKDLKTRPANGVSPAGLRGGYYHVREGQRWRVVRWVPWKNRWEIGGGNYWPPNQWDEIGAKVA